MLYNAVKFAHPTAFFPATMHNASENALDLQCRSFVWRSAYHCESADFVLLLLLPLLSLSMLLLCGGGGANL
jgi:hypothetical protein